MMQNFKCSDYLQIKNINNNYWSFFVYGPLILVNVALMESPGQLLAYPSYLLFDQMPKLYKIV